nr:ubiquitin-conjugating enzyme E2 7 [Tanacetum cinerariifolium]
MTIHKIHRQFNLPLSSGIQTVCISILHPPGEDPNGYETVMERWNPVHTSAEEKERLIEFIFKGIQEWVGTDADMHAEY